MEILACPLATFVNEFADVPSKRQGFVGCDDIELTRLLETLELLFVEGLRLG